MHIIVLSCLKASGLVEKKITFKLSFIEKMQLKIHTSVCKSCTLYEKQSTQLDLLLKQHIQVHPDSFKDIKVDNIEQLKNKIIKSL